MQNIKLTPADLKKLNDIKKELLTNTMATTSSHTACNKRLKDLADKYQTDMQTMYDLATYTNQGN
jgi:hypothetical protein